MKRANEGKFYFSNFPPSSQEHNFQDKKYGQSGSSSESKDKRNSKNKMN